MAQKVTSTDIKLALKEFHNGKPSYFITECKTCSTYFPDPQGLLKFDGLAITKSYTKPNIIGYEIKVSRNDFLQDNKWHLYLQYCNEFYFVVPKGLVKKEELPDHVGLIYFNPDTKALRTVKKALYRQIEEPVGVYKYIIFSRLEEDRIPFYNDRAEYCKDYLEDKVVKSAMDLLSYAIGIPEMKYFNLDSDELLDEKIEVLTQIKEGKTIAEIPNFYKVLEDLPEDDMWD